jgi:hypothetical protein
MIRAVRLGAIVFLLIGAGVGLCVGMLTHNEPPYRVHLEESMPLVFLGGVLGAFVGCGVTEACIRRPRLIRAAGLISFAMLGTALAAPLGWIAGTVVASERLPRADVKEDVQHLPPLGMAVGAWVGCVAGLGLGRVQVLLDRRRPNQGAACDRRGSS